MEEWKEYRLSELCDILSGGTPKTTESKYWSGGIPWLSVKDFGNVDKYVYTTEKTITNVGFEHCPSKMLQKDDIIISARGTVGAIAMISSSMSFNQSCFGLRGNDLVDKHFLYYLIHTKVRELRSNSHGSVFDTITRNTFDNIICNIPSKVIQHKIATILSFLDDKIELNRKINSNLVSILQYNAIITYCLLGYFRISMWSVKTSVRSVSGLKEIYRFERTLRHTAKYNTSFFSLSSKNLSHYFAFSIFPLIPQHYNLTLFISS